MTIRTQLTFATLAAALAGCAFDGSGVQAGGDPPPDADPTVPTIDGSIPDVDGTPGSGRFRKAITVASGTVDEALTDFPLYVELADADLAGHASAADLHFVAGDGTTPLDHELQAWDPDTGHLEAWVRIPTLSDATSTTIYLRYGAFDDPPPEDPAGVWQNGFVAVWHLDDTPDGTAGDIDDAHGAVDATSSGLNANSRVDGIVGAGLAFTGNDELTFTNPLTGASAHTISAWVEQQTVNHNSALVVLGNGACAQSRWLHTRFTGGPVGAGFYCDDWGTTGVDVQADGWALVHWTYVSGQSRLYRDGALAAGPFTHLGTQSTVGTAGFIGDAPTAFGNPMGFVGTIDEVRIANVDRTAGWIAAEHANQSAPATFYATGAEQELP